MSDNLNFEFNENNINDVILGILTLFDENGDWYINNKGNISSYICIMWKTPNATKLLSDYFYKLLIKEIYIRLNNCIITNEVNKTVILYNNSKIEMIYSANYRSNNIDFNFELVK